MITYEISEELKNAGAGIYKITFSNGLFYIGSSKNLRLRIHQHAKYFKSGCSITASCTTLEKIKDFNGHAVFSLVEEVEFNSGGYQWSRPKGLIQKELAYILTYKYDPNILNDVRKCGNKKSIAIYLNSDVYSKLKQASLESKIPISHFCSIILEKHFKMIPDGFNCLDAYTLNETH